MNKKKIADKLIELRGCIPREKVCNDLGISFSSLQSYELGIKVPKDETKIKLAKYYNSSVQEIFFTRNDT